MTTTKDRKMAIYVGTVGFLVLDFAAFAVPLGSCLLAAVVALKPRWFYDLVKELYGRETDGQK